MKMKQYAIVRTPDELAYMDAEWYFDDDGIKAESGDYNNILFIVPTRDCGGFNADEWKQLDKAADFIIDAFDEMGGNFATYNSFKEAVEDCPYFPVEVKYSPKLIHDLKEWWKKARCYNDNTEDITDLLTIITGKKWDTLSAYGYCQGDYCEVVYCTERYSEKSAQAAGEVYVGRFASYEVVDLDENGEEIDRCGGYVIADCQGWTDDEHKRLVCEWAGIKEDEAYFGEAEWQNAVDEYEEERDRNIQEAAEDIVRGKIEHPYHPVSVARTLERLIGVEDDYEICGKIEAAMYSLQGIYHTDARTKDGNDLFEILWRTLGSITHKQVNR